MYRRILIIASLPFVIFAAQWQSLNGPPAGRANDMSIGKYGSQYHIYAADRLHRLYKSINEGISWNSIQDERVSNPTCVITRTNGADYVYIGKNGPTPVWWSTNGGQDWFHRSGGTFPYDISNENPRCFLMDPNNSSIVYLGCTKDNETPEMFKTTNGGSDWSALDNFPNITINEITITTDPVEGTWIFAACSGTSDRGIWFSTNGGDDWDPILSSVDIYTVEFASQSVGYAGATSGVYKTITSGDSWELLVNSPAYQVNDLEVINTLTVYAATNDTMIKTTDGGASWNRINVNYRCDKALSLLKHPQDNQTIFSSADWCIYKTTNAGNEWFEITDGYAPAKLADITTNLPTIYSLGRRISGRSDVSIFRSDDCGNSWLTLSGSFDLSPSSGLEPHVITVHPESPDIVLLGARNMTIKSAMAYNIYRSTDAGNLWERRYSTGETSENKVAGLDILHRAI